MPWRRPRYIHQFTYRDFYRLALSWGWSHRRAQEFARHWVAQLTAIRNDMRRDGWNI